MREATGAFRGVVRSVRAKLAITQQQLAALLGVSENQIHQYESGKREPRSTQLLLVRLLVRALEQHTPAEVYPPGDVPLEVRLFQVFSAAVANKPAGAARGLDLPPEAMKPGAVRRLRTRLGITQGELGELLGVQHGEVHYYETGRRKPRRTTLLLLAVIDRALARRHAHEVYPRGLFALEQRLLAIFRAALVGDSVRPTGGPT